ncbi:MAG: RecQ family ATP-dependent DNA helicase [Ignavibacteria bacterium]|nr:RecQ family ATP-dependent DNA helicase [Ignavibacteria bacterium]
MTPQQILKEIFGYDAFRSPQEEIIESILSGKDTVAILPTGAGKSICYQIPAMIFDGLTIVISPLISLMKDQVEQIKSKVKSEHLHSLQSPQEQYVVQNKIISGGVKLLYVSPERFIQQNFSELLSKIKISFIAIDEAHCVSEWGHDFRPSYLKLKEVISSLPKIVIAAFTATATPEVQEDIIEKLGLIEPNVFIKGFERQNLQIKVFKVRNRSRKIIELVKKADGSKIIYCQSRREVDELNRVLVSEKVSSLPYHAGMSGEERKLTQDYFLNDKVEVIVATNAFGMGINKENIRMVIHQGMPGSIESYYQEIGRAGRDGSPSEVCLIYNQSDRKIHEYFIKTSFPTRELIYLFYNRIHDYYQVNIGGENQNKIETDAKLISKILMKEISPAVLNSILTLFEKHNLIRFEFNLEGGFFFRFTISNEDLKKIIQIFSVNEQSFIDWTMRHFGSRVFSNGVKINYQKIENDLALYKKEIDEIIFSLDRKGIIDYKQPKNEGYFYFIGKRVYAEQLPINYAELEERAIHNLKKLDLMENFVHIKDCRWKYILNYFHETVEDNYKCGKCDNCIGQIKQVDFGQIDLEKEILKTVKEVRGKFGASVIIDILRGSKSKKIAEYRLHEVSTYGFCSGIKKDVIKEKINSLLAENKLNKTSSLFPTIYLTEDGEKIISGINVKELVLPTPVKPDKVDLKVNLSLYERLRDVRNLIAKRYNQPSFMICSDEVLREASIQMPQNKNEFFKINGVGEKVFLKCGDAIINEINNFLREQEEKAKTDKEKSLPQNIHTTLNMIREGMSLIEICEKRNLSDTIISEHIQSLLENSFDFDLKKLIPQEHIQQIESAIKNSNTKFLPSLKSLLPDEITYAEIRICLSYFEKISQNREINK